MSGQADPHTRQVNIEWLSASSDINNQKILDKCQADPYTHHVNIEWVST